MYHLKQERRKNQPEIFFIVLDTILNNFFYAVPKHNRVVIFFQEDGMKMKGIYFYYMTATTDISIYILNIRA